MAALGPDITVVSDTRDVVPPRRIVRQAATISRVDPWTVLKLSLIFYFCFLLVAMLGLTVFWAVLSSVGVIEGLTSFLNKLQLTVVINGGNIARAVFLLGILNVVLWTGINVFLVFLYNLVADVIGGLRIELDAEE
ncbi:MAG: DUF3566 domain-containing protein [Egibacteraceae bacterium]